MQTNKDTAYTFEVPEQLAKETVRHALNLDR